jgi:hypothetical protein
MNQSQVNNTTHAATWCYYTELIPKPFTKDTPKQNHDFNHQTKNRYPVSILIKPIILAAVLFVL